MAKHNFKRTADGDVDLTDAKRITKAVADVGGDLRVTREVQQAAGARIVELAAQLAFSTQRSMGDATKFIVDRHPDLVRLWAGQAERDDRADVGVVG
jgi:hypothetical protein